MPVAATILPADDELMSSATASSICGWVVPSRLWPRIEDFIMKHSATIFATVSLFTTALVVSPAHAARNQQQTTSQQSATQNQAQSDAQSHAAQMAQSDINKEKQQAEQDAQKSLDQEAIAVIKQTKQAIDAINSNHPDQALAQIEQATGKVNVLLARNPATALVPVSAEVEVIDAAPNDVGKIREMAVDASWAVEAKNFPAARVLLDQLRSEIHVRTYNLPLATYPVALQQAARLIDQKKTTEAATLLQTALSTLVAVDKVTPLPLVVAREAVNQAQAQEQKDKNNAKVLLQVAKKEVQIARELGYAGKDQEYATLNDEISNVEKQLNGGGDTNSTYAKLKQRLSAFLNRQSQQQNGQPQPQRTAQAR
jgi:hypothetical protein